MSFPSLDETIIAVSTPPGIGGLGIVRLSGRGALSIAGRIFKPRRKTSRIQARRAVLGDLYGPDGRKYDEAFLTYFKAPHSYTREDVVELSCHGSPAVIEETVRLGIMAGARHAHPGEFTLRAYLRGRIDILQAEAVQSLINATSLSQARVSYGQVEGGLSLKIAVFREKLVSLLAQVEARLEFPDEGLSIPDRQIEDLLQEEVDFVEKLAASHEMGRLMTEGATLAIAGRTNVGKSTLFNALAEKDRAIVTPYPGTTRDYLQEKIRIDNAFFNIVDMAGLVKTSHPIEKEGVSRSRELALRADGILLVLDASRKESRQDLDLIKAYSRRNTLIILNKIDLPRKIDMAKIRESAGKARIFELSALKGVNLKNLRKKIASLFSPQEREWDEVILHSRQKMILEQVRDCLAAGHRLLKEGHGDELCAEEIRKAFPLLGQLTGEIKIDEVIHSIFDRFCIGK